MIKSKPAQKRKSQFFDLHSFRICVASKHTWFNSREPVLEAVEKVRSSAQKPVLLLIQDSNLTFKYLFSSDSCKSLTSEFQHLYLVEGIQYKPVSNGAVLEYERFCCIPRLDRSIHCLAKLKQEPASAFALSSPRKITDAQVGDAIDALYMLAEVSQRLLESQRSY